MLTNICTHIYKVKYVNMNIIRLYFTNGTHLGPFCNMVKPIRIRLFGAGCERCIEAERIVKEYFDKRKIEIILEKVNDLKEMVKIGIVVTPAIEFNGKLLFHGRIPKTNELKKWLTQYMNSIESE